MTKKMGRPRIEIDWVEVEKMCQIMCTQEEIADILGIDGDTLTNACKRKFKMTFSEYYAQKSAGGKRSLRRRQFVGAMEGNTTLLIWLGKQMLGQSDKSEIEQTINGLPKLIVEIEKNET